MEQATAGQSTGDQAKEKATQAKDVAQEKTQQAAGQARERVREQVDQRSTQGGEQLTSTAGDLRSVGEELRNQGKEQPAKVADQVADRVERLGGYMQESDADRILGDVEDFGRRQPWAVVAGGLALGFAASRFLKASSQRRYQASRQGGSSAGWQTRGNWGESPDPAGYGSSASGTVSPEVPAAPAQTL